LQDAFRALGGHITGVGSNMRTYQTGSKMHTLNSEPSDPNQSTIADGSDYHQYMQKDDVEMNGMGPNGRVLVTHHIETIVDKRSFREHQNKWDSQ
jgi:hypothetical protein